MEWKEHDAPYLRVAQIRIPKQRFEDADRMTRCEQTAFNPWHCLPEHRPLGNQSRARRRMYLELSRLRQSRNQTPHEEPTGNELPD